MDIGRGSGLVRNQYHRFFGDIQIRYLINIKSANRIKFFRCLPTDNDKGHNQGQEHVIGDHDIAEAHRDDEIEAEVK